MLPIAVRRAASKLPPRIEMGLRIARSQSKLGGFFAPGRDLSDLVPRGKLAIDAGANAGIYSYWMLKSASQVVAFEPQPLLAGRLAACKFQGLRVECAGLSDRHGTAKLHIPAANAEASLRPIESSADEIIVQLTTLDSYAFHDIGFLKVDVEGHEEALLRGAETTLRQSDAVVYIEIEERHNPGGLDRIVSWFTDIGYTHVEFRQNGAMLPFDRFELRRDQLEQRPLTAEYANNFLFRRPGSR